MNYIIDHIPNSVPNNRRPCLPMTPTTITIHNTGNPASSARNERNWLTNLSNKRTASYHLVVDEREVIECLPLNECAWHAGDGNGAKSGNRTSIGIEICESGDYAKTLDNAAELVAKMLRERGWGVDRLRRHFDWSGKICPRLMYDGGLWTGWTAFVNMVQYKLRSTTGEEEGDTLKLEQWQWKMLGNALDGLYRQGVIGDYTWAEKAYTGRLIASELAWLNMVVTARQTGVDV
nr:N-acetylmuramoyl-L-alanine amidase [Aneurinibacillus sp. XH2]